MHRFLFVCWALLLSLTVRGQATLTSRHVTAYDQFKPAVLELEDGRTLKVPYGNVFLKNSGFVYRHTPKSRVMEASMGSIKSVDFDDRHYVRIDSVLAWRVDTVGQNALYCVTRIDLDALRNTIINSRDMTDIQLNSFLVSATKLDVTEENIDYPVVNVYYYLYRGKLFKVHERELSRRLSKDKRREVKVAMSLPGFSWTDPKVLMDLLRRIS